MVFAISLTGCAITGQGESPLPRDGAPMVDIYRKHMENVIDASENSVRERMPLREATESTPGDIKRNAIERIDNRFPRLPNPDLVMVVLPHLAKGQYPIPGYVTVFPMYEKVEYAMPGEVSTRRSLGGDKVRSRKNDREGSTDNAVTVVPAVTSSASK